MTGWNLAASFNGRGPAVPDLRLKREAGLANELADDCLSATGLLDRSTSNSLLLIENSATVDFAKIPMHMCQNDDRKWREGGPRRRRASKQHCALGESVVTTELTQASLAGSDHKLPCFTTRKFAGRRRRVWGPPLWRVSAPAEPVMTLSKASIRPLQFLKKEAPKEG
jgi:hypothetical protein